MATIGTIQLFVVVVGGVSAMSLMRLFDPVVGGLISAVGWLIAGFLMTNAERVSDCCVTDVSSSAIALLFGGIGAVMLLFALKPALVSLNPRSTVTAEAERRDRG